MPPSLTELEARVQELIRIRASRIARAQHEIAEANRQFDEHIYPLGREINRLRGEMALRPAQKRTRRPFTTEGIEDWTAEEVAYYKALKEAKNGR
jgi:hypothetical protein